VNCGVIIFLVCSFPFLAVMATNFHVDHFCASSDPKRSDTSQEETRRNKKKQEETRRNKKEDGIDDDET
jgi:hypothetical protein